MTPDASRPVLARSNSNKLRSAGESFSISSRSLVMMISVWAAIPVCFQHSFDLCFRELLESFQQPSRLAHLSAPRIEISQAAFSFAFQGAAEQRVEQHMPIIQREQIANL